MKNNFTFLSIALFTLSAGSTQAKISKNAAPDQPLKYKSTIQSHISDLSLRGKVKMLSVKQYKPEMQCELNPDGLVSWRSDSVGLDGYFTGGVSYKNDGTPVSRFINKYDGNKNLLASVEYNADGSVAAKHIVRFDGKTSEVEVQTLVSSGVLQSVLTQKVDGNGNVTEKESYSRNGDNVVHIKWNYAYDIYDNVVRQSMWVHAAYGSPDVTETIRYKYNRKGYKAEQWNHCSDTTTGGNNITTYEYDAQQRVSEEHTFSLNGALKSRKAYQYVGKETKIREDFYIAGDTVDLTKAVAYAFKNDDKGNEIEHFVYKADGSIDDAKSFARAYVYDKAGNTTKETYYKMEHGKPVVNYVTETAITYYN